MKATDLRIGNWITGMYGTITKITEISKFNVRVSHNSDKFPNIQNIKPIPLTEEWLIKFGFNGIYIQFYKDGFPILYWNKKFYYSGGCSSVKWMPKIKYVHQLQNLYFALTGKELEIKE